MGQSAQRAKPGLRYKDQEEASAVESVIEVPKKIRAKDDEEEFPPLLLNDPEIGRWPVEWRR